MACSGARFPFSKAAEGPGAPLSSGLHWSPLSSLTRRRAGRDLGRPGLCYCCCLARSSASALHATICLENSLHSSESFLHHQLFRAASLSSRWESSLLPRSQHVSGASFLLPAPPLPPALSLCSFLFLFHPPPHSTSFPLPAFFSLFLPLFPSSFLQPTNVTEHPAGPGTIRSPLGRQVQARAELPVLTGHRSWEQRNRQAVRWGEETATGRAGVTRMVSLRIRLRAEPWG